MPETVLTLLRVVSTMILLLLFQSKWTKYVPSDRNGTGTHLKCGIAYEISLFQFVGLATLLTDLLGAPKAVTFWSIDCFTGFLGLLLDLSLRDCGARAIVATARFHSVVTAAGPILPHSVAPRSLGHVWPIRLVKAGRVLKPAFIDVEDETLAILIKDQGFPWNGEKLVAHPKEATDRQHRIRDAPRRHIDHDFLD